MKPAIVAVVALFVASVVFSVAAFAIQGGEPRTVSEARAPAPELPAELRIRAHTHDFDRMIRTQPRPSIRDMYAPPR